MLHLSITLSALHRVVGSSDPAAYVDAARVADASGVHQIALSDHVVMGERTDRYPFGKFPFTPDEPWPEPLALLSAIAAATTRVRLATSIVIATLRPAVLLAKTVATIDALSKGRVDLGVGVGWQEEEYRASGLSFERPWSRLDDTLRACRVLWSDAPATFQSPTVSFDRIYCAPRPSQSRVPIWFGAKATEALARRIAELGDGWCPLAGASPVEELRAGRALISRACEAVSRDPNAIGIRAGLRPSRSDAGAIDWPRTMAAIPALANEGATSFALIAGPGSRSAKELATFIEDAARAFDHARG